MSSSDTERKVARLLVRVLVPRVVVVLRVVVILLRVVVILL